jgi:hypothetical protein
VYFDQLGSLSALSILLVVLGTIILLSGVWLVSLHSHAAPAAADGADIEVTASPETSMLSPAGADASETTALLGANAAGIAGPHLPPVSPASEDITPPTSPTTARLGSPRARRHSRSASLGIAGLGLVLPDSPLHTSVHFDVEQSRAEPRESPTSQRRTLYSMLLQRGLSIGISPSSPGFHIHPPPETLQHLLAERAAAAAAEEAAEDAEAWRRRPRRTLSEGDALHVEAARGAALARAEEMREQGTQEPLPVVVVQDAEESALVEEEEEEAQAQEEEEQQPQSSAWTLLPRALDYAALSARLRRLRSSSGAESSSTQEPDAEPHDVETGTAPAAPRRSWLSWR